MDGPDPFADLTADEVSQSVYARLYEEDAIPGLENFPHREFAPGVLELLALDLPDSVAMFRRADVERFGGWQALREQGLRNLASQPIEQHEVLPGPNGVTFNLLIGDSVHTASRALTLPQLLLDLGLEPTCEHGFLVGFPNRHQLAWSPIGDGGVVSVIQAMTQFISLGFSDAPGPISPFLYWWDGTTYQQLSHVGEDGQLQIHVDERFSAVLDSFSEDR